MVGPGEVDAELEAETKEECSKFGRVRQVLVYEVRRVTSMSEVLSCLLSCLPNHSAELLFGAWFVICFAPHCRSRTVTLAPMRLCASLWSSWTRVPRPKVRALDGSPVCLLPATCAAVVCCSHSSVARSLLWRATGEGNVLPHVPPARV